MNAAARALTQGSLNAQEGYSLRFSSHRIGVMLLVLAVLASALAVVYVKNLNRQLFSELQTQKQAREELRVQWGQLMLEERTWASSARVQTIAQQKIGMVLPTAKEIVLVTNSDKNTRLA